MGLKWANFARAKLATPPSGTGGLSFTVEAGKGALFPTLAAGDYFYAVFKNAAKSVNEVVKVEARSTDAFTIAAGGRGLDDTTAQTWTVNDYVELCATNIALQEVFNAAVTAIGALTPAADRFPYYSSATGAALGTITAFARTVLDDASNTAARTTLGLNHIGCENILLNGAFNFLRDSSLNNHNPTANAVSYLLQRWYNYQVGGITGNMSVSQLGSGPASDGALAATNKGAYPNCVRITRGAGATLTDSRFKTIIASSTARLLAGKPLTIRFFARKGADFSPASSNILVTVISGTGSDQSAAAVEGGAWTGQTSVLASNQAITADWAEYSLVTTALPSTCNQLAIGFHMAWVGTAGANDYVEIAGVRVGASGVSDIPISDPPADVDFERCVRFFECISAAGASGQQIAPAFFVNATQAFGQLLYESKRTTPAITVSAASDFLLQNQSANDSATGVTFAAGSIGLDRARMVLTIGASRTAGDGANVVAANTNARIYVDAEFA